MQLFETTAAPCFFLDGDWCWDMVPFTVSEKSKKMVIGNIVYLLNSFLKNPFSETVLFCWVLPDEAIINEITDKLTETSFSKIRISLICSPEILVQRLKQRENIKKETIERSLAYLPKYQNMNTLKINTDRLSAGQTARQIYKIIMNT
ncbi:MAG: AAA family ATPase [Alphaproteobacteria bacterium]